MRFFSNVSQKFNIWKNDCISAEATEEELKMIASDNETFKDCVNTFIVSTVKIRKEIKTMTNFEYIINRMNEKDLALFIECGFSCFIKAEGTFTEKCYDAFTNWRESLAGCGGNMYFVDDKEHQPNVFAESFVHLYRGKRKGENEKFSDSNKCNKYVLPRKDNLSIQIWLSKQYNQTEWEK